MISIKKVLNKQIILYVIFGVLTTLVNIIAYYFFSSIININYLISNTIAWVIAVTFAYVSNKMYVFNSTSIDRTTIIKEFITFVNCRLTSGAVEIILLYLLVDVISIDDIIAKLLIGIIVVILNFMFSKIVVFKNNGEISQSA